MSDWPVWVIVIVILQIVVFLALLGLITRRAGWRKVRVGFFAEREYKDDPPDNGV